MSDTDTGLVNTESVFQGVTFLRSASIARLVAALAKAQGGFVSIRKTNVAKVEGDNARYSYKYAELADFLDAVRRPLAESGLALTQPATAMGNVVTVETTLWHESGEWLSNVFVLSAASPAPQKVGSALTFARRYALCALLGIAAEKDDDDGAAAMDPEPQRPPARPEPRRQAPPRQTAPRAPADGPADGPAEPPLETARPRRRGPKALSRLREDCERHGLEADLVAAVEAAGGAWDQLPDDCGPLFEAGWAAVGERLTAAKSAALDGAHTHNTPEAVAAKVAETAAAMKVPF